MVANPIVSVIITTHNRADYLREAIDSVLSQTFCEYELILCDDASIDDTPSVCQEIQRQDPRVHVLRHEQNLGMVGNWNSGLEASQGKYFCKLDDDNRYLPTFLEKTVQSLVAEPDAAFVFTDEWFIDSCGQRDEVLTEMMSKRYGRNSLNSGLQTNTAALAIQQAIGINSTLFVREAVRKVGGFREEAGSSADMDLFLNLACHDYCSCFISERLDEYREHKNMGSHTPSNDHLKAHSAIAIWKAYSFQGIAEQLRCQKLAQAYVSLSRTLLLNGDIPAAQKAVRAALRIQPTSLRSISLAAVLRLPRAMLRYGIQRRYGKV